MSVAKRRIGRFAAAVVLGAMAGLALLRPAAADMVGHGGMVRALDVSPDGTKVLTGSFDYTARLWNFGEDRKSVV